MAQSYKNIPPEWASQLKLVMTDVDGTLTPGGDDIVPSVLEVIKRLEERGISVGLVSGRSMPGLKSLAEKLGISGPIIAENGGVARLKANAPLVDLGYSRQPAVEALRKLQAAFPDRIRERQDNRERLVDVVFWAEDIPTAELRNHLADAQLLDSGYILHLMQPGISKGTTLMRLLGWLDKGGLSPDEVLVIGDSATDQSLFELFPHSVLIPNPRINHTEAELLQNLARYMADDTYGDGFASVVTHLLSLIGRGT